MLRCGVVEEGNNNHGEAKGVERFEIYFILEEPLFSPSAQSSILLKELLGR